MYSSAGVVVGAAGLFYCFFLVALNYSRKTAAAWCDSKGYFTSSLLTLRSWKNLGKISYRAQSTEPIVLDHLKVHAF
jgi:vacuolar-type H+-ATPase subunit I/STV1